MGLPEDREKQLGDMYGDLITDRLDFERNGTVNNALKQEFDSRKYSSLI